MVPLIGRVRRRAIRWLAHGAVATAGLWAFVTVASDRLGQEERAAYRAAGPALLRWGHAGTTGPRTIVLNGADILVETGSTSASVAEVLDGFAARCAAEDFFAGPASTVNDAVLRDAEDARGVVACSAARGITSLESLARMASTGALDAAHTGLRYVYAEREADTTRFVALWSDALVADERFPADGDAPGSDPAPVPRPPVGRRALTATERGKPYAMALYLAPAVAPLEATRRYQQVLDAAGFERVGASVEPRDGDVTWLVRSGDTFAAIAVFPQGGGAAIAVAVARGGPGPLAEMIGGSP